MGGQASLAKDVLTRDSAMDKVSKSMYRSEVNGAMNMAQSSAQSAASSQQSRASVWPSEKVCAKYCGQSSSDAWPTVRTEPMRLHPAVASAGGVGALCAQGGSA
eukprot:CAMPEP_0174290810 /NCGR_PEP_ID=MMETSP0809-20121228/30228_1 /TAXON_ID=73025 ORGANISM="Eutreptiella gymnastica-like, Strain CCMP1594" /NCGR_SAMPLE_ID=MMETSP0809 /ASSEMBLY_ACC=CAM_ASM_000658 /LENGTH=103 /DNA_ID=CAMNT_0015389761 /DNA_START=124 /DNA_END=435 /DNA_ORIENTATION=-